MMVRKVTALVFVTLSVACGGAAAPSAGDTTAVDAHADASLPAAPTKAASRIKLPPEELAAWETVGIHCSANERRADEAPRVEVRPRAHAPSVSAMPSPA